MNQKPAWRRNKRYVLTKKYLTSYGTFRIGIGGYVMHDWGFVVHVLAIHTATTQGHQKTLSQLSIIHVIYPVQNVISSTATRKIK